VNYVTLAKKQEFRTANRSSCPASCSTSTSS